MKANKNKLRIYHEGKKRRIFVGELSYDPKKDRYALHYDEKYVLLKSAIPLSPDLSLFKLKHYSKKGELFPVFVDRIPDRLNPAYVDYCRSQGISPHEKNPIILLGSIGRRGPSSFIYEPVYEDEFNIEELKNFLEKLKITQHDFSVAFDFSKVTLQRVISGVSQDANLLKRIQILFRFPEVALWQLSLTGARVHAVVLGKLISYFQRNVAKRCDAEK